MKKTIAIIIFLFIILFFITYATNFTSNQGRYIYNKSNPLSGDEDQVIKVGGDMYLPPFSYMENNKQFVGFSIDILNAISKKKGLNFTYIPMKYYQAEKALREGKIDIIMGMKYTATNNQSFALSESYFTMYENLVIPKNEQSIKQISDLKNKVVAIQDQQSLFDILEHVRRVQLQITTNSLDGMVMLKNGRADAYLGNQWTAKVYLKELGIEDDYKIISFPIQPSDYTFASRNENKKTIQMINSGLQELKEDGTFEQIYYKWFGESFPLLGQLKRIIYVLIIVVFLSFIIFTISMVWNKRLKGLIEISTKELRIANQRLEKQKREIASSNLFKETVLNYIRSGIVALDHHLNITFMNEEMRKILRQNEHLIYQIIKKIIYKHFTFIQRYDIDLFIHHEEAIEFGHEKKYFSCDLIPLYQMEGLEIGYILTIHDMTEEKRLQQKLFKQEKLHALGQLIAGIAHELRNPLYSIKTFIELLPHQYNDSEFRSEISYHVPAELNRMNKLIQDLIDYSKQKVSNKTKFKVIDWIDSILLLFNRTFAHEGIDIVKEVDDCTIYADKDQLKQVVINILLNAIEELKKRKNGKIIIQALSKQDKTIIRMIDNGKGISEENLQYIFEPFYTTKPNGVGLGLFISQKIIGENNGEIDVSSTTKGTTFVLEFPSA